MYMLLCTQQVTVLLVLFGSLGLAKFLEVHYVTSQSLSGGVDIVVLDAILLTGFLYNWSDKRVVGLDDTREQVMSRLMV